MRATRGVSIAILGIGLIVASLPASAAAQSTPAPAPAAAPGAAAGGDLQVTVTYSGKGVVGTQNEIAVFLFDTPIINASSQPIAIRTIEKNGGSAQFTGLTAPAVYVAVAYDEKGTFTPGQGPPPSGTPTSIHGETKTGSGAAPVKPGKGAKVAITFNDAVRMQQ